MGIEFKIEHGKKHARMPDANSVPGMHAAIAQCDCNILSLRNAIATEEKKKVAYRDMIGDIQRAESDGDN